MYARDLAEAWGVGGAETEEGVLMLVAPNEREVFIATARGVQGTLTDISTGRIIRETMVPAFREGNYAAGIAAGVERIIERLDLDPAQAEAIAEAEAAAEAQPNGEEGGFPIGAIFWIGFLLFFFVLPAVGRWTAGGAIAGPAWAVWSRDIILWEAGKAVARGLGGNDGFGRWRFWRRRQLSVVGGSAASAAAEAASTAAVPEAAGSPMPYLTDRPAGHRHPIAVEQAESTTSGEIVTVLADRSDGYFRRDPGLCRRDCLHRNEHIRRRCPSPSSTLWDRWFAGWGHEWTVGELASMTLSRWASSLSPSLG